MILSIMAYRVLCLESFMLNVIYAERQIFAESRYAECRYAECRDIGWM
jgi:hypothetical protein